MAGQAVFHALSSVFALGMWVSNKIPSEPYDDWYNYRKEPIWWHSKNVFIILDFNDLIDFRITNNITIKKIQWETSINTHGVLKFEGDNESQLDLKIKAEGNMNIQCVDKTDTKLHLNINSNETLIIGNMNIELNREYIMQYKPDNFYSRLSFIPYRKNIIYPDSYDCIVLIDETRYFLTLHQSCFQSTSLIKVKKSRRKPDIKNIINNFNNTDAVMPPLDISALLFVTLKIEDYTKVKAPNYLKLREYMKNNIV